MHSTGESARSPPSPAASCGYTPKDTEVQTNLIAERKQTMRILFINNDGGGFADYVEVSSGKTVEQFFKDQMHDRQPEDYLIRVNRQPVPRDYVLQEKDRVTLTPVKIEGARR
jgi:sulfur carrier protein ThiS